MQSVLKVSLHKGEMQHLCYIAVLVILICLLCFANCGGAESVALLRRFEGAGFVVAVCSCPATSTASVVSEAENISYLVIIIYLSVQTYHVLVS